MGKSRDELGRFLPGHRVHKYKTITKEKRLAEARRKGELKAELEAHEKKPLMESAKEHLGKMIDNIDLMDLTVALAFTPLVHSIILTLPDLMDAARGAFILINTPTLGVNLKDITSWITEIALQKASSLTKPPEITEEMYVWLLSFAVAYVISKNAGTLIGLVGSGLNKIVPFLLGVAV